MRDAITSINSSEKTPLHKTEKLYTDYKLRAEPISTDEISKAKLTPRCIVENYLYEDVGVMAASGGTGKTTLVLFEMIHIVLGRELWGNKILSPGTCLFVTSEDERERLVARLARMMQSLELTHDESRQVREGILILDLSGLALKLVETNGDIQLTALSDAFIEEYKYDDLSLIVFDPLVSFGATEGAVNDNPQALIVAARRIKSGLKCCVRYIHHTGQSAAQNKTLDQYSTRGGTALSDGARMVTVIQKWEANTTLPTLPKVFEGSMGEVLVMANPKLSYCNPRPPIFIMRDGWFFQYSESDPKVSNEIKVGAQKDQLIRFLTSKLGGDTPIYLTRTNIEDGYLDEIKMARKQLRHCLGQLEAEGRVITADLPDGEKHGKRKTYLKPMTPKQETATAG